jgi:putative glutamine amidotransferase
MGMSLEWAEEPRVPWEPSAYAGLLLTGGRDVHPRHYGEEPHPMTRVDPGNRDGLEIALIRTFLSARKPIVGICRGIQILNVALGGGLIQDLDDYFRARNEDGEIHTQVNGKDENHGVVWVPGTDLARATDEARTVNSAHHQAVDPLRVGQGLRVVAVSPMGIIEAMEGDGFGAPIIAVQWHPERLVPANHPASYGLLRLMKRLA